MLNKFLVIFSIFDKVKKPVKNTTQPKCCYFKIKLIKIFKLQYQRYQNFKKKINFISINTSIQQISNSIIKYQRPKFQKL